MFSRIGIGIGKLVWGAIDIAMFLLFEPRLCPTVRQQPSIIVVRGLSED